MPSLRKENKFRKFRLKKNVYIITIDHECIFTNNYVLKLTNETCEQTSLWCMSVVIFTSERSTPY